MHRCWAIPELTRLIVEQLDATCIKTDRPALANLARTSSIFFEPAVDALWYHLDSLAQLLWLLPQDALSGRILEQDEARLVVVDLTRLTVSHEWDRFKVYAYRVKSIGAKHWLPINSQSDAIYLHMLEPAPPSVRRLSGSVFEAMRTHLTTPILPNLQELQWVVPGDLFDTFDDIELFVTPRLERLYVGVEWPEESEDLSDILVPTLQALPRTCPRLQEIQIFNPSENVSEYFLECLSQLTSLHSVAFWYTGQHFDVLLHKLRKLPHLRSLHLRGTEPISTPLGIAAPFTLRRLALTGMRYDTVMGLLRYTQPCGVTSLEFELDDIPTATQLYDIFVGIRNSWADTMEDISITTHESSSGNPVNDDHVVTLETLQPLLYLPKLCVLSTGTSNVWDIDDGTIRAMVSAWRSLRVLNIESGRSRTHEIKTTARSLVYLAHYCRHLETLALSINARAFPFLAPIRIHPSGLAIYQVRDDPRQGPQGAPSNVQDQPAMMNNPNTTKLLLGHSTLNNQAALLLFLLKCFPNLEAIETYASAELDDTPMEDDGDDEGEVDEEMDEEIDNADMTVVGGATQTGPIDGNNTGNQQPRAFIPWVVFLPDFKLRRPENWQFRHIE
ncbi:hypothetical protein CERSUDRAFT_122503 [Gelatoporia subvermispora B]|uniref:F-box domain-containing protein n=1 Tax=Ceriporiopsis subvermispora (strain B) TaxID=914234 RepID=M2R3A2_CERS8|nr:hypothetical protein CERSUDRAFT_122503 [Gelatoporia subvermispora B]